MWSRREEYPRRKKREETEERCHSLFFEVCFAELRPVMYLCMARISDESLCILSCSSVSSVDSSV